MGALHLPPAQVCQQGSASGTQVEIRGLLKLWVQLYLWMLVTEDPQLGDCELNKRKCINT